MTATEYDRTGKIFDDSIHGRITLHPLLEQIVDTPQIQRLRHIKQLGGIYYDYIGAERSRFQHSIGMCHLSGIFLETLQKKQADLSISKRDTLCVQIAALCRNLGQGPFSYLFEELVLPKIRVSKRHWKFRDGSIAMFHHLLHTNNLRPKFEEFGLIWEEDIPFIEELITGNPNKGRNPDKRFLYEIVTNKQNGIDVNKMDYIARDSQELCYSHNFDWKQYMNSVRVIIADDGFSHICCREDEVNLVHDFYRIRFNLFYDYYQHWKARAIENMIAEALVKANEYITISGEHGTPRKLSEVVDDMYAFTKLTDSITEMIRMDLREEEMKESKKLLNDIQRNQIHQYIGCLKYLQIDVGTDLAKRLSQQLADIYDDIETESNIKLQANFILLDVVHLDLGRGEHDPMRDTWFYNPDNPNVATRTKEGLPTTEYTVPNMYQWMEIRVYSRWNNTSEVTEAIKRAFERFLKVEGHNGIVHDSSSEKGAVTQQQPTSVKVKKVPDITATKQDKGDVISYRPTTFRLMLETKNREIDDLKAKNLELKAQSMQLQKKVDENEENERKIESLKKMSKNKDKEVESTKKFLEDKKLEIVELKSQNETLQSNLNEKDQEIEQKRLECERLSNEVRQLQSVEETLAEESLNIKAQKKSSNEAEESNKFRFFSTLFFVVLVCYSYINQDQFPSPLPGVNVIASNQLTVIGGQVNELHWMEYGLNIYIPSHVLPKGVLAKLAVRVSLFGPFSYPDSHSWKTSSAIYWLSSSKDFEESVIISIWHTVRNFQNNSQLRFVSSNNELVDGKYLFKVLDGGSFDNSYGHIAVSHFSPFGMQSGNQTEESFLGRLFYRRRSQKVHQWDYSFLIYHDMPIGLMETVLAKSGEYTGWHKDPQITVEFDKDDITLELNDTVNVNGWTLRLKYFPAKYEKNDLSSHFGRIISNMQFTVKQTRKDLSSYLNARLPLIGSKRPQTIPVDIDTDMDIEETAYNPGTLTEITSVDELQPWLEYVTSPLIYSSCLKMGKEEADRANKEQILVEERVYQITKKWFDQNTSCTWKDFAKSFACMKNCKIAEKISKEKFVYFFKETDADIVDKCPNLPII